jgi:hypothetical protein
MESMIFKSFKILFKTVVILMMSGTLVAVLTDLQRVAFHSKSVGLTNMLKINQQLVGKTK